MPCNKKRTIVLIVVSAAADPGRLVLAADYRLSRGSFARFKTRSRIPSPNPLHHEPSLSQKESEIVFALVVLQYFILSHLRHLLLSPSKSNTARYTSIIANHPRYHRWKWTRHSNPAPSSSWKRCVCLYMFPDLQEKSFVLISSCV